MIVSRLKPPQNEGKQIYLSGGMQGYEQWNFPAFMDAAEKLRKLGYLVFNPAEQDLQDGFDPVTGQWADGCEKTRRELILYDVSWICQFADMIVVLPGWLDSSGSKAEVYTAKAIGIPVVPIEDMLE